MLKKYYLLGSIALFFLSGCARLPLDPNIIDQHDPAIKDHVIAIGKEGELREPLTGEAMNDPEKEKQYLNNIVEKIKKHAQNNTNGNNELLIYIHGGLNTEGGALKRALEKYRLIKDSGGKYPVFINWRSGPKTTYGAHLARIRQGEKSGTAWATSPVYLATDVGKSIVNAPKAWLISGEHLIRSTMLRKKQPKIDEEILDLKQQGFKIYSTDGKKSGSWGIARQLQWLATSPIKVVTTPFAYTMSKPAWDIMLRRTSTLFYTPCDLKKISTDSDECEPDASSEEKEGATIELKPGNGALYRFLSALEQGLEEDRITSKVKITLIGHSMGAIVVNDIVNLGLNLTYENIVHMASADSIENLFNKVIPYIDCSLEGTCNNGIPVNFYSLYLHPDNENREVSAKGFTPSGSLLTWIDSMFMVPKTVLDKRSGRWDNMTRAIELIPPATGGSKKQNNIRGQMRFTIFDIEDRKAYGPDELKKLKICKQQEDCEGYELYSTAQEHGDFGDLPFWRPEVWKGEPLSTQEK